MGTTDRSYALRTRTIESRAIAKSPRKEQLDQSSYQLKKLLPVLNPACCCDYSVTWLTDENGEIALTYSHPTEQEYIYSAPYAIVTSNVSFVPEFYPPPAVPGKIEIKVNIENSVYIVSFVSTVPIYFPDSPTPLKFTNGTGFIFRCAEGQSYETKEITYILPPPPT